jgi:hypothetical protein
MPLTDRHSKRLRKARSILRPLDVLIVASSAALLVALSIAVYGGPPSATLVVSTEMGEWVYPMSQDRDIEAQGPLGITYIHIGDGNAHIEDSPCANKTCVASLPISKTGEWAACLPNGVFIHIEGAEDDGEIDAFVK